MMHEKMDEIMDDSNAQPVVVRREQIEAEQSAQKMLADAQRVLAEAKAQAQKIREDAFQEGFEQGINEANLEVGAQLLRLKDEFFHHQQAMTQEIPLIVAEICAHLVSMDIEDKAGFEPFMHYLESIVHHALTQFSSQTNLLLRVGAQFAPQLRAYLVEKMSEAWVDKNLDIKPDPDLTHFAFSIEHDRGILHFDGKDQLANLLAQAFSDFEEPTQATECSGEKLDSESQVTDLRTPTDSLLSDYLSDNDELGS